MFMKASKDKSIHLLISVFPHKILSVENCCPPAGWPMCLFFPIDRPVMCCYQERSDQSNNLGG